MRQQQHLIGSTAGAILLVILGWPDLSPAEGPLAAHDVLYFDPGPVGSAVASRAVELNPESDYSAELGYGWTQRPQQVLERRDLQRSRTPLTIDGVSGKQFEFQADIASGEWHVILWLETGERVRDWPRIIVQGRQQTLAWQPLRPSAEPRRAPPKQFRVFHSTTAVSSAGVRIKLVAQDSVRLLGISLIRQTGPTSSEHHAFLREVEAASDYRNGRPLSDLLRQAKAWRDKNPDDAFYAIWQHRLELLESGERYYSMRGWQWADEEIGLGMFDRHPQVVMLLDGFLMASPMEAEPLTERARYLRGRLLYWMAKERGGAREFAAAAKDLHAVAAKHPDDDVVAMYLDKRVDLPDACDCLEPTPGAPAWSTAEREALCRLRLLVHWWVTQRQTANGELGGKYGDDVEMLRWWAPLCLAGDETALRGWKLLADGVWHSKHLVDGYARKVADVEHAAEFIADTTPLMLLYDDHPCYVERLAFSARHFESLWTGISTGGNRHFRSAWFGATEIDSDGPRGRDVEYNTRAVQALRYLAWRRPDPSLIRLLHEWSTAWANAAMRSDKGKPKGIIPASIRFPDDAINGDGQNWHQSNMFWDYYDWEHYAGSLMLDQLLFTYTLTDDERLLEPMFASLELIRSEAPRLDQNKPKRLVEGSRAWTADRLIRTSLFWNVVEQWRDLTGDSQWDDLIRKHGTAFGRYRISGDEQHLAEGLNSLLEDVRYNTPLKTTEAVYTDRVRVSDAELLKKMLTGDGIQHNLSPFYAVSWQQTDSDFTALVRGSGPEHLEVDLFYHGTAEREVNMRVWKLTPGEYELRCNASEQAPHIERVSVSEPGQRIPVTLPAQRLLHLSLRQAP
jgi:hypothetical protein